MVVEIRIYKRYDVDLIALCDAGYPIADMMARAITAYAHSEPFFFKIDKPIAFDLNGRLSIKTRISIPNEDKKTCYMLKHVKHGLRNNFCKMILRNSLLQQNLCGYFSDDALVKLQEDNLAKLNIGNLPIINCSDIKRKKRTITFAGKTIANEPIQEELQSMQPKPAIPNPKEQIIANLITLTKEEEDSDLDIGDFLSAFDAL